MGDGQVIKERIKYQQPLLHFMEYCSERSHKPIHEVPWHVHKDFEISGVKSGKVIYKTLTQEVILNEGDAVFINSNVIHCVCPIEPYEEVKHFSHFFDNYFIAGGEGSIMDTKYVYPLQHNENVDMIVIRKDDEYFSKFHEILKLNTEISLKKEEFYEFELRKNVCDLWKLLVKYVGNIDTEIHISAISNKRLRKAIVYIQKHYSERITLRDISDFVHISTRECERMFVKYLKISPISYLHSIRLQKATAMLMDLDKNIFDIAVENGYSSSSHFGKIFKEHYNLTPKEYRDNIIKQQ